MRITLVVAILFLLPVIGVYAESQPPTPNFSIQEKNKTEQSVQGTWHLVSYESRDRAGTVIYPMGRNAVGILLYDSAGYMAVQLVQPGRPTFIANDFLRGTSEEVRSAYEGYLGYFGRYTVDAARGTVTHHITAAWFPNWAGVEQVRNFRLQDGKLILSTPWLLMGGKEMSSTLVWERAK